MSAYVKTFKIKDRNRDKNNKLMYICINDPELLKQYKAVRSKIEDLKNIELNSSPVYDNRSIKNKIKTYGDKVYTIFHDLNVPEDDVECESFTFISIDYLLAYKSKYYLQVYLDNCVYKIIDKQMIRFF